MAGRREGAVRKGGGARRGLSAVCPSVGLSRASEKDGRPGRACAPMQPPPPGSHSQFQRKCCSLIRIIYKIMVHCLH